jgi:hypothetical protein
MKCFLAAVALLFLFVCAGFAQDKSFVGGGLSVTGSQGTGSRSFIGVFAEGQYSDKLFSEYLRYHVHNLVTVENEPKIGSSDGTTLRYRFQPLLSYRFFGDNGIIRAIGGAGIQLTRQTNKFYSQAGANPLVTMGVGLTDHHTFTGTYIVEDSTDWNNNFRRGTRYGYNLFLPLEKSRLAFRGSLEYERFSFENNFLKKASLAYSSNSRNDAWTLGGRVGVVFH